MTLPGLVDDTYDLNGRPTRTKAIYCVKIVSFIKNLLVICTIHFQTEYF